MNPENPAAKLESEPLTWARLFARVAPFLLGFLLVANLFLIPSRGASPRTTDLIGALLVPWLLTRARGHGLPTMPLAALAALAIFPLAWTGMAYLQRETATMVQAMRWLLAIPWALTLVLLLEDETTRHRFVRGMLWGCAANVAVVGLQALGLESVLRPLGIAAADTDFQKYAGAQARFSGLHRHYGASAAVTSLIVPTALYLYLKGKARLWLPLVALAGLALTTHYTSTRSPLIVSALTLGVGLAASRRPKPAFTLAALVGLVVIPALLIFGPPGGKVRWEDPLSFEANASERWRSNVGALDLMMRHPQGMGFRAAQQAMIFETGIGSTHNAYLQAGLYFGAPLGLALFITLLHHGWRLIAGYRGSAVWASLIGIHIFGLFFFEEHLNNATFVILATWLVAQSAATWTARSTPRAGS